MKQNIDFYQHYADADQHPKFKMLRAKYGWAGEGKFWALNNRIAQAENCCLDISKKYNRAAIAVDLDFSLTEFDEYILFLLDECELVRKIDEACITTDIVQENFGRVTVEREKARERSQRRWEKSRKPSGEKKKTSGEKVCKGKESKGKENNGHVEKEILEHLNKISGRKFQPTKTNLDPIKGRLNEKFTPEDLKLVCDFKWQDEKLDKQYFRPSTLFRPSNFEGYLYAAREKMPSQAPKQKQFCPDIPK